MTIKGLKQLIENSEDNEEVFVAISLNGEVSFEPILGIDYECVSTQQYEVMHKEVFEDRYYTKTESSPVVVIII